MKRQVERKDEFLLQGKEDFLSYKEDFLFLFCSTWLIESSLVISVEDPSLSGANVIEPELDLRIK
jgi:hypothetical protein